MITLTTPHAIRNVIGGVTTTDYNKLVISTIAYDVVAQSMRCTIRLTSTGSPNMTALRGNLEINTSAQLLTIEIEQLDLHRVINLTTGQNNTLKNMISDAQNAIESGLITLGAVAGTQSNGT